ncbi:MAG: S8 family serine peptidase [Bacteroidota bacterium]
MNRLQTHPNTTKKLSALLFILLPILLFAQDNYYWSDDQRIELTTDQQLVSVELNRKLTAAELADLSNQKDLKIIDYQKVSQRLLIDFSKEINLQSVATTLRLDDQHIRQLSHGLRLSDGFPLWLTDQVVFKLHRSTSLNTIKNQFIDQIKSIKNAPFGDYQIIQLNDVKDALPIANELLAQQLADWAHPDFYAEKTKHVDPLYGDQFQLNSTGQNVDGYISVVDVDCNAPEAWTVTKGDLNMIIAVIDDGVEAHEDLVMPNGNSALVAGYTPFSNGDGSPGLDGAHGQSCAGIISAAHNDIGVRGIAPNVKTMPINIFAGEETISQIANGFNFARINGAAVLSNSWGYSTCEAQFDVLNQAIANAANNGRDGKGCLITFASGNSYGNCVEYPANLSTVIGVGAVTNRGLRSDYSNYGNTLDLVAPSNGAAGVRTIDRMGSDGYTRGNYALDFGGTSAACPVVSGVAALLLSAYPNLTAQEATAILYNTAKDIGASGRDVEYGYGIVDAAAALRAAGSGEAIGYCSSQGNSVRDEWIGEVRLGDFVNISGAAGYSDFTDQVITVQKGNTYNLSITPQYSADAYPDAFRVWIDYNQNEIFEANELVFEEGLTSQTVSGQITIPTTVSGSTRMRVALKFEAFPEACEIFDYGEVEDYTIQFVEDNNATCETPTNLAVELLEERSAVLSWSAVSGATAYDMLIRAQGGDWISFDAVSGTSIQLINFSVGTIYEFSVRSICVDGQVSTFSNNFPFEYVEETDAADYCDANAAASQYQWIDLIELNEIVNATGDNGGYADFTDQVATIQRGATETIYISKGPNTSYVFHWTIYIDYNQNEIFESEELIVKGESDSNDVLYAEFDVPTDAPSGQTRLRVLMKYNDAANPCGEFEYGEVEDYTVNVRAIGSNHQKVQSPNAIALADQIVKDAPTIELFPNPTSDFVRLRNVPLSTSVTLRLLDARGQLVRSIDDWNGRDVDMYGLADGCYFLDVQMVDGKVVLPFVISR